MEKLKYTLFDLFVYTVPGMMLLFCGYVVYFNDPRTSISKAIQLVLNDATIYKAVMFVVLSYCVGFICSVIGNYYLSLREKLFPLFKPGEKPIGNSKKFVQVRERSLENFKYIEQWNVLKNFSSSFSFVLLLLSILFFYTYSWFTLIHLIVGVCLSLLVLNQASVYHRWALIDLDNAYKFSKDERNEF